VIGGVEVRQDCFLKTGEFVLPLQSIFLLTSHHQPLRPIFGLFYSRLWSNLLSGNIDHGKPV
jgi:hypothetical protein